MSNCYLSCRSFIVFKYFLLLFDFWTQGPRSSSGPTVPSPCWPNASQVRNLPNRGLKRACHQAQISPTHDSAKTVFSQARAQVSFWMTPGCPHSHPDLPSAIAVITRLQTSSAQTGPSCSQPMITSSHLFFACGFHAAGW